MQLADYGWESLRGWCVWYITAFLEYTAQPFTEQRHTDYRAELERHEISWRQLRREADGKARAIVEDVTAVASEAAATGRALPGELDDARQMLAMMKTALEETASADEACAKFKSINARFDSKDP